MKIQVNRKLLPVKAHYFFFFAALGPILPQLNMYGRQLGVSAEVMGFVTAGLPLLWAAAKPTFGYIVDYWPNQRKLVFMFLIIVMTGSYCGLWFIPAPDIQNDTSDDPKPVLEHVYRMNNTVYIMNYNGSSTDLVEKFRCHWSCSSPEENFEVYLTKTEYINTLYIENGLNVSCADLNMNFDDFRDELCTTKENCNLLCFDEDDLINTTTNITKREVYRTNIDNNVTFDSNKLLKDAGMINMSDINVEAPDNKTTSLNNSNGNVKSLETSKEPLGSKDFTLDENDGGSFYVTAAFWSFVVLMCVGTVAFNVANCIGDAVCFDVLGPENGSQYGSQRAWGTAGYGVTALLGGWLVDRVSAGRANKDFSPAFLLALVATAVDLASCRRLKLPALSSPADSGAALRAVLRLPRVVVFICFAVVAGMFDSFIIYYMFWFLEDLAEETGHVGQIKLIEGIVVAGQSFIGEIVFFALSGRIINRWGYGVTLSLSLFCYGVRMALISLIRNPWHLIPLESIMQGPTYALCYSTIVGYAAHVAPEGYSATVQGIVAGMDDGVGFALGSLVGGQLFGALGGRAAFRVFGLVAALAAALHASLRVAMRDKRGKEQPPAPASPEEGEKMLPIQHASDVYRETVLPVGGAEQVTST